MNTAIAVIMFLVVIIVALIACVVLQLSRAGIKVKDFSDFINANQELDTLYAFSKKYEKMTPQEQVIFLKETEKVTQAFDKIPEEIWDDEYIKYKEVIDAYRALKVKRWKGEE